MEIAGSMAYWNHSGRYQKEYEELSGKLVPAAGMCETVEGELLRAISKIYYDYFNNGFGNNWSGAWKFLENFSNVLNCNEELVGLAYWKRGIVCNSSTPEKFLDSLVDKVMKYVVSKNGSYTPNITDMWTLQEPDDGLGAYDEDEDHEASLKIAEPGPTKPEAALESKFEAICERCGNLLENKDETICSACKATSKVPVVEPPQGGYPVLAKYYDMRNKGI